MGGPGNVDDLTRGEINSAGFEGLKETGVSGKGTITEQEGTNVI
jgi:hypothetical protein